MAVTQPSGMVKRGPFRHFKTTLEVIRLAMLQ